MTSAAREAIVRDACAILGELYPATRWATVLPRVGAGLEAAPAMRELKVLIAAEDDPHAVADRKVARLAQRGTNENGVDAVREQAA
jgi:hypothetical protein